MAFNAYKISLPLGLRVIGQKSNNRNKQIENAYYRRNNLEFCANQLVIRLPLKPTPIILTSGS